MAELTLLGLRVVERVAALGSITAAADALGYTQSAVSRQVAAMESATRSVLFERRARGVVATLAGQTLARRGAAVVAGAEAAGAELAALQDRLAGRLAVGAYPSALADLAPRAMARLREDHPGLAVVVREGGTLTQLRRLRAGRLDVAIVAAGPDLPDDVDDLDDLRVELVRQGRLLVAVPAAHRLANRARVGVNELADEPWVAGTGTPGEAQFGPWPTLTAPMVTATLRDWPARLGLVAHGLALTVVPDSLVPALPAGVRAVDVDDPDAPRRRTLVATARDRSPSAQALVDALLAVASR